MTPFEREELEILRLATTDTRKFAIELGLTLPQPKQDALERLMLRDWIRLIDVSRAQKAHPTAIFRVFRAMPEAVEWFESRKNS